MMSESIFMKRVRGELSDEESRWWRAYFMSAAALALCCALAFDAVRTGHSYFSCFVPVFYAWIWRALHSCKQLLASMAANSSSPELTKLSSELRNVLLYLNMTILGIVIFCVARK
jgi:hypothetical protein